MPVIHRRRSGNDRGAMMGERRFLGDARWVVLNIAQRTGSPLHFSDIVSAVTRPVLAKVSEWRASSARHHSAHRLGWPMPQSAPINPANRD